MTDPTVISTSPSGTELCHAVGVEPVAVSHQCDFPPAVQNRPSITGYGPDGYTVDTELLEEIDPDLVVTQSVCDACAVDETLVRTALDEISITPGVVSLNASNLGDVPRCVEVIGQALGRPDRAERVINQFRATVDHIKNTTETVADRPRVVVLEWLDPLRAAGNWVPEMVTAAGGQCPLGEPGNRSTVISRADLRAVRPDVLVVAPCGHDGDWARTEMKELREWDGWRDLPAVRNDRVFTFDGSILSRWTPRLAGELERLAAACHPELLGGCPQTAV